MIRASRPSEPKHIVRLLPGKKMQSSVFLFLFLLQEMVSPAVPFVSRQQLVPRRNP